ncbi:MAG: hypothetical protein KTR28_03940 [Micavibrio sp.]|nr:hypothetical protein [Micavibrio sp.]
MSELITEVEEAIRRERAQKFWTTYGSYLIGAILFIILATAAYAGYDSWSEKKRLDQTEILLSAREAADYPANVIGSELNLNPNLKTILQLDAAAQLLNQDNSDEALALYKKAADNESAPEELRQLAAMMVARLQSKPSEGEAQNFLSNLESIASDSKSPWRYHAMLETAAYQKNVIGDSENAIKMLEEIQTLQQAPPTLKERAKALAHVYSLDTTNENK